jgi:uncharacterized membrane protein
MSSAQTPVFEALIVPHRSLSRNGVRIVVALLFGLSAAIALRFWLWGAWPVVLCTSVEVPLLVLLLAINQRRARASELIMLDTLALHVIRTDPAGRRQQDSLPAAWLRVDLNDTKGLSRIVLSSHGKGLEVGAFLHEPEKASLYAALKEALHHSQNPRFDNPQLREE